MSMEQAVGFLVFALVAAVTPGPSNIMLTAVGAQAGVVRGLPCLLGVSTGMGLMMFLVPLGLGSLVLRHPLAVSALHWGGAAMLLWLSWKIATTGRTDATIGKQPLGFWGAAAFQWINPKSWLVSVAGVSTYLHPEGSNVVTQAMGFGLLFILAAFPSCFVWLAFGAGLQQFLHAERTARIFNAAMGILLAGAVLLFIF
jgi:threonine/homoserine/homoserine lactone efflux protein